MILFFTEKKWKGRVEIGNGAYLFVNVVIVSGTQTYYLRKFDGEMEFFLFEFIEKAF